VAAAVVLGEREISGVNDSKALRPDLREKMFGTLLRSAEAVSIVAIPAWWIDRHGVGLANREALITALSSLRARAGCRLADGNLKLGPDMESLPRADARSAAVAAASVVAKVVRDDAMRALSECHGGYGFERNRGYGTSEHREALVQQGPCRVHRLSYAGVGD
jgi:ribonuclease HII